jgi:hypothetical protein
MPRYKNVNGIDVQLTPEEEAARDAEEAAFAALTPVRIIMSTISSLEADITPRRIREAVFGTDGGWLSAQEALIAIERAKL